MKTGEVIGPDDGEPRRNYEGVEFQRLDDRDSGRVLQNLDFRNCSFDNCRLSVGIDPSKRTAIRRVRLTGCRIPLRFGLIGSPILDEVEIEDFRSGQVLLISGAAFRRVILKGHLPPVNFNEKMESVLGTGAADVARRFAEDNRRFYQNVDWALDIREAEFGSARLSSIPGDLIRRDAATQVLVSRRVLRDKNWQALPLPAITRIAVEHALASQYEYQVIVAAKRSKTFAAQLQGIEILRRERLTID